MKNGEFLGICSEEELVPKSVVRDLKRQVKEPERMLGKKTRESGILKRSYENSP